MELWDTSTVVTSGAPPQWFAAALDDAPEHLDTVVRGCRIHLRCWGVRGRPGLVLVHGGTAHSGWWDHIAPALARTHRVVALDLSGHGDSDWRSDYGLELWAAEVPAAAAAGGVSGPFTVAGHSMGGWVAAAVGVHHADRVEGIVVIDSPLNDRPPEEEELVRRGSRPTRIYPTSAQILARFATLPPQDVVLPYLREHLAEVSIRPVEGGWTWKFDPALFGYGSQPPLRDVLSELRSPAVFIRCEFGLVPTSMAREIDRLLGGHAPMVELVAAGHHPMLDQPLSLITALRTLLAAWAPISGS